VLRVVAARDGGLRDGIARSRRRRPSSRREPRSDERSTLPRVADITARASKVLPRGVSSLAARDPAPVPLAIAHAEGARVTDVDGRTTSTTRSATAR
jgi:hypothetical protein